MFKNPWVIGGGVVIGIILLVSKSGGGGGDKVTERNSYVNEVNAMGYQANVQLAEISMQEAGMRYEHDATIMGYAFQAMMNRANVAANFQKTQAISRAGVLAAHVQAVSAAIQDRQMSLVEMANHAVASDPAFTAQMLNPGSSPQLRDGMKPRYKHSKKERDAVGFGKHFRKGGFDGVTIQPPVGKSA